ncbi:chemotaxis protein methyltransferase WspC [Herbaspirillum rubrisubalbicans]|uniref:Methyltransferase n=1 Tax=Herbaspirillum rubrisubalbicans Os34 TaxID=1235827 RepID=A0A6M3ZTA3_9BURK|nr:protein-glutamate O-methyltransferase CheR [Herbaspirillum rubrisubalbicans]MCP1573378.1 chemotaxis protein methyltransferase WspC [Herbaspirillum rubrisubalbicans]QJQ01874.1 methyltransferase [Herbaspirillum rubrisubalbicans Os34]
MKTLPHIAELLKAAMGLDMATVGSSLIERVVRERMAALEITDDSLYLAVLQTSETELQALIESAVVPETWFFRDREAIFATARLARQRLAEQPAVPVRILSLPCSTGEEPYSLAMALQEEGVAPTQFVIDAYDIRTRSLEIAAAGVYGRNSFRGQDLGFRDRHFTSHEQGWQLQQDIRQQVRFAPGNLLAPDFLRQAAPYDFIFCRNVLIYFEREVQQQVVALLESLMKPDALVFVGPAEGGILLSPRMESAGIALAFGFRQRSSPLRPSRLPAWITPPQVISAVPSTVCGVPRTGLTAVTTRPAMPQPTATAPTLLQQARALADQGQFTQAEVLCEQVMVEQGPSAEAFYLQGLIHDAGGQDELAQRSYRKALYLQPQHQAALLQLAALLQAQGDAAGAERMRQRAARVSPVPEGSHG